MKSAASFLLDRRMGALAILLAAIIGSLILVIATLAAWRSDAAALAVIEERTELLEARAASIAAENDGGAAEQIADARILVEGATAGLASAELQRIVSAAAERVGAAVRTLDAPDGETVGEIVDADGNRLVKVRLNAQIEVLEQALPDLLHAIEAGYPVIVIESFALRANRAVDSVGGTFVNPSDDHALSLRLTVSAFRVEDTL